MGGTGSGRKSIKGEAIKRILDVLIVLTDLKYEQLHSNKPREELDGPIDEAIKEVKKTLEELERI